MEDYFVQCSRFDHSMYPPQTNYVEPASVYIAPHVKTFPVPKEFQKKLYTSEEKREQQMVVCGYIGAVVGGIVGSFLGNPINGTLLGLIIGGVIGVVYVVGKKTTI
jgi:uncharacterized protein YcfJ